MKKYLLILILFFSFATMHAQDIKPYYEQGEYKSSEFHRFQISTNYRMFIRDIPIDLEYSAFDTYSVGVFVGFMPSGEYSYLQIGARPYKLNIDKMAMIYGAKLKSWFGAECYEGFYGEINYLYANIPNYKYQEIGIIIGGQISVFKIAFIDLGVGFGGRIFKDTVSIGNGAGFEFAEKFNLGIGLKIK